MGGWDFFWPEAVVNATIVTMILKLLRRVKNMRSNPVAPPVIEQRRPVEVASIAEDQTLHAIITPIAYGLKHTKLIQFRM